MWSAPDTDNMLATNLAEIGARLYKHGIHLCNISPISTCVLTTNLAEIGAWPGLDIGLRQPLARGASESENPLAPQKTHWPPKNM